MIKLPDNKLRLLLIVISLIACAEAFFYWNDLHKLATDGAGWVGSGDTVTVHAVYPGGPADRAGIKTGDRILTVNGASAIWTWAGHNLFHDYHPRDTVMYRLYRAGTLFEERIILVSVWEQSGIFYWFFYFLPPVLIALALFVTWRRIDDTAAIVFFFFVIAFAIVINGYIVVGGDFDAIRGSLLGFSFSFISTLLLHFCLLFPTRVRNYERWRWLIRILYGGAATLGVWMVVSFWELRKWWNPAANAFFGSSVKTSYIWTVLLMTISFSILFVRLRRTANTLHRNQLRTMAFGLLLAWFPTMVAYLLPFKVIDTISYNPAVGQGVYGLGAAIFSGAMAIAIVRYKIWDIEVIIRRTALYTAVVGLTIALYTGCGFILQRFVGLDNSINQFGALIVAVVGMIVMREFLQSWIDRLFHRERRDVVDVILRFDDNLQGITEEKKMRDAVLAYVDGIFHFSVLKMVDWSERIENSAGASDLESQLGRLLKADRLSMGHFPVDVQALPKEFADACMARGFEFLVPLVHEGAVEAMLFCGPLRSGKPYSVFDRQLLAVLAQHAAAMLRMARSYGRELERQLAIERERERISRDLHDDLGSNLSNIALAVDLVRERIEREAPEQKYLEQVSSSARQMTDAMRDIVWMVNPEYDTLDALVLRMRDTASRFLVNIPFSFETAINAPGMKIPAEVRRTLYMIFKESINNAAKHSRANRVSIQLEQKPEGGLYLRVVDNGIGFDPAKSTPGNGIRNMYHRSGQMKGNINITAAMGEGCAIGLTVNIP